MYELVVKHLFGPALDFFRGTKAMKLLEELEETQWWPRHRILALQNERLSGLLRYAYDNVPYYQRIFEQGALKPDHIHGSDDLMKLPVLTRQLVKDNFADLTSRHFPRRALSTYSTGGSTGEPLSFIRAKDDIASWDCAAGLRASKWAGYTLGMKCAILCEKSHYGSTVSNSALVAKRFFERIKLLDVLEMGDERTRHFAKRLEGFQGGFIKGYPTAIYLLARFIEREGTPAIRPKAIIASGEGLYSFQRELFAEVFKCDTFSCYRSNEVNTIAGECSEHAGHHISAENVIVEIVDDSDKPVPAGQEGRVLVTNLHSHAMPFIRYDIGDVGVSSDRTCNCGRGLPLLEVINGRITDVIYTVSGKSIPGVALPLGFFATMGVDRFQIVQDTYEKVTVRIVVSSERTQGDIDKLSKGIVLKYKAVLGADMGIDVELVDQIAATQSGKRRIVISNIKESL
ncbi:phenylacetate--CoA ligase family protein [Chloroflexota bacterium]